MLLVTRGLTLEVVINVVKFCSCVKQLLELCETRLPSSRLADSTEMRGCRLYFFQKKIIEMRDNYKIRNLLKSTRLSPSVWEKILLAFHFSFDRFLSGKAAPHSTTYVEGPYQLRLVFTIRLCHALRVLGCSRIRRLIEFAGEQFLMIVTLLAMLLNGTFKGCLCNVIYQWKYSLTYREWPRIDFTRNV